MLGHGDVDLLVGSNSLGLLLALHDLVLGSVDVAAVDVRSLLGVILDLVLGLVGLKLDGVQEAVELVDLVLDDLLKHLLDGRAEDLQHERLEQVEQSLVSGLLKLDVEVLDIDVDVVNLEEVLAVLGVGGRHLDLEAETSSTEEDVHQTFIADGWESLLLADVVADIAEIHLNTAHGQHNRVLVAVGNVLASPAPVVVAGKLEHIGSEVVTLNHKVLNHRINHGVSVLDARYGNIADVLEDGRKDDVSQVLDEVRLEGRLPILVITEVIEQPLAGIGKAPVVGVLVELVGEELDLISDAIGVVAVTVAKEEVAAVVELVPLIGSTVLHDVALLAKALSDVGINLLEPVLQLRVSVSVAVDLVDRIHEIVGRSVVGETLNESLEVLLGPLEGSIGVCTLDATNSLLGNVASVASVLLSQIKERVDGLHVVLVSLDLHHHLLQAPDGLIAALFRHLRVEVVLGLVLGVFLGLLRLLLGVVIRVVVSLLLEGVQALLGTSFGINAGVASLLSVLSAQASSIAGVAGVARVRRLGGIARSLLEILRVDGSVLVDGLLQLVLQVASREIGGVVPGVVGGRLVDLLQLILRWVHLVCRLLSDISSHVAEKNRGIVQELSELA